MTKWLIGFYSIVAITIIILAALYPEEFALALGFFVLGSILGGSAGYYLFTSIHDKGFERSQALAAKQVANPASIMREARMMERDEAKRQPVQPPQQQPIPRIKLSGINT